MDDVVNFREGEVLRARDVGVEYNAFSRNPAVDVDSGDADGMFVKTRPGKFQVRSPQLGDARGDAGVGLRKDAGPRRRGRAEPPGLAQTRQFQAPFDGRARYFRAEVHEIDD